MIDDGNLRVFFGNLQFDLEPEELISDDMLAQLETIGITVDAKKDGGFRIRYRGIDVSERLPLR